MQRSLHFLRPGRGLSALLRVLVLPMVLVFAVAAQAHSPGPDRNSGLSWGDISYFVGGGSVTANPPANGTLAAALSSFQFDASAVDSHGNLFFGTGFNGGVVYMVYENTATVPALLAKVTTQASPSTSPVVGGIYLVAGGSDAANNCLNGGSAPYFCQDAATALQATFGEISYMSFDTQDNLYISDGYFAIRKIDSSTTAVSTVAGQLNTPGTFGSTVIGDGGPATSAFLTYPGGVRVDAAGNLYIVDSGDAVVRVVYEGGVIPPILAAQQVSPSAGYIYTVAGQAAQYCASVANGGTGSCNVNASALTGLFSYPLGLDVDASGNIYVSDSANDVLLIYSGKASSAVPPLLHTVTAAPTAGYMYQIAGQLFTPCSAAPCGDGAAALQAQISPADLHVDSTGDLYLDDAGDQTIRKIDAAGYISPGAGTESAGTPVGSSTGVGGPAISAQFQATYDFSIDLQGNLYIVDQNDVWQAPAAQPQSITFSGLPTETYGAAPVTLAAVAVNSANQPTGLPITYAVTAGPGQISNSGLALIITGAGTIQVTATQAGGSAGGTLYAGATATQSVSVGKAQLTVTANNASKAYGASNPALSASYTGFVNGDTAPAALTGQPALSTTAVTGSSVGTYPIVVTQGTLTAANYNFTFVNGSLVISGSTSQTITFPPVAPIVYGQLSTLTLTAVASSGLAVQYTLGAGSPATVSGSTLSITGAGTIVITASQPGNSTYAAASAITQSLIVNRASLSITGPVFSLPYGTGIDASTFPAPTILGFVNGDTQALITGAAAYSTTASGTPHAGSSYPVQVALGTLALLPSVAQDYTFASFAPGRLTIVPAPQTISFDVLHSALYGQTQPVHAVARDANGNATGLPVTLSSNAIGYFGTYGQTSIVVPATDTAQVGTVAVGTLTVSASQPGTGDYAAAAGLTQSVVIAPAPLSVTANSFTREFGAANPELTFFIGCQSNSAGGTGCFVNNDSDVPSVVSGMPVITASADPTTSPGTYPIQVNIGTLTAPNYYLVPVPGTLTILPAGSYTIGSDTPSLTIPSGQSRQVTLTLTPLNLYQGTVTMGCGQLPANVTCIFSPATYTFAGANNANQGANPAMGTLTINTLGGETIVGSLAGPRPQALTASILILPGSLAGLLLTLARRRLCAGRSAVWQVLLVSLATSILGLAACGGASSTHAGLAAPGTINLTITGTGTSASNASGVVQSLNLSVVIQ